MSLSRLISFNTRPLLPLKSLPRQCKLCTEPKKHPDRPVRGDPEKTFFCLIPGSWPEHFYDKTGVTGLWTFFVTLGTYLISKEKFVMEHEFYTGLGVAATAILAVVYIGPGLAKTLDKGIDDYEWSWNKGREDWKTNLRDTMEHERYLQWSAEGQFMLVEAKRENVGLQLEDEYRNRQMTVYNAVKTRLEYELRRSEAIRYNLFLNMCEYVENAVLSSITTAQEEANIDRCIQQLNELADEQGR